MNSIAGVRDSAEVCETSTGQFFGCFTDGFGDHDPVRRDEGRERHKANAEFPRDVVIVIPNE
jgi:hypothetical protein